MMKNWRKKLISLLLTLVMVVGMIPTLFATPAYAATTNTVYLDANGGTLKGIQPKASFDTTQLRIRVTYGSAMPSTRASIINSNKYDYDWLYTDGTYYYGNSLTEALIPKLRTGYTFIGWFDATSGGTKYYNADGTSERTWNKAADSTLYAQWTPNKYKVTFNGNGQTGTYSQSIDETYASKYALPSSNPTKTGYVFAGWFTAASNGTQVTTSTTVAITGAQTLYAHWTPITFKVAYNGNGSTGGSTATQTWTYDANTKTAANGFTRTGYTFAGWNADAKGTGTPYNANNSTYKNLSSTKDATVTLYAQWTPNTYTIVYDTNGGETTPDSTTATYDVNATLAAAPARTGYTFAGWKVGDTTYNASASVINLSSTNGATVTATAQWTENTATLTYNDNGHGTAPEAVTMKYTAATNAAAALSEKGFVFNGWNTAQDGTGTAYAAGAVVKAENVDPAETTLYAQWLTVTDWHLTHKKDGSEGSYCDSYGGKGGLMGHQEKIKEPGVGRTIIGLTQKQLEKIGDTLVIVGGDYGIEATVTIDCAYTYFYDNGQMITAEEMNVAAFVIIENDGDPNNTISGYGYYRLYSNSANDENNFLFDVMFKNPVNN